MYKKMIYGFLIAVVVLNVVGLFVLPDTLAMHLNLNGETGMTVNKYLGLAIIVAIDLLVAFIANTRKEDPAKGYLLLAVFLVVNIVMFVINL